MPCVARFREIVALLEEGDHVVFVELAFCLNGEVARDTGEIKVNTISLGDCADAI